MYQPQLQLNQRGQFPVPGQSLTNDPENPAPFEGPPEFTNVYEASEFIFETILEPEVHGGLLNALEDGTAIFDIVQLILFKAFQEGKIDPNLMMLMAEPVTYMLLAIAERAGIDPVFTREDEEDEMEEAEMFGVEMDADRLKELKEAAKTSIPEGALPPSIMEKLKSLPERSILEKPDSLMAR